MNEKRDYFQEDLERLDETIRSGCKEAMATGYGFREITRKMIMLLANGTKPGGDEITIDEKRLAAMISSAYYLGYEAGKHREAQDISA